MRGSGKKGGNEEPANTFGKMTMDDPSILFRNIEQMGRLYREECLNEFDPPPEGDWWAGLKFFFGHSFMRGRRDELSGEYCQFAIAALEDLFSVEREGGYARLREHADQFTPEAIIEFRRQVRGSRGSSIKHPRFSEEVAVRNTAIGSLTTCRQGSVKPIGRPLTNDEDLMMVLDVLKLISCPERQNIYCYVKNVIIKDGPEAACRELTKIRAVGRVNCHNGLFQ